MSYDGSLEEAERVSRKYGWPLNHRKCTICKEVKHKSEFHKGSERHMLRVLPECKTCRKVKSKQSYAALSHAQHLYNSAKGRSRRLNLDFDLTVEDIKVPRKCPVLGEPLIKNTEYASSLDRIDPSKGYIKGNIQVLSVRANMLKNNASIDELERLLSYRKRTET